MIFCTLLAHSKLWGLGIPCVIMVDSKATTGSLLLRALLTCSDITTDFEENLRFENFNNAFLVQNIFFAEKKNFKTFFKTCFFQFTSVIFPQFCQTFRFGVFHEFLFLSLESQTENLAENQNKNKNTCFAWKIREISKNVKNAVRHRCKAIQFNGR